MATGNRWGRAVGAGFLEELAVVLGVIVSLQIAKRLLGWDIGKLMAAAHSQWVPGTLGPIVIFLLTRWVVRPLPSNHLAHAMVVASTALAIQALIDFQGVQETHISLWAAVLAGALKLAAAIAAAMLAKRSAPPATA